MPVRSRRMWRRTLGFWAPSHACSYGVAFDQRGQRACRQAPPVLTGQTGASFCQSGVPTRAVAAWLAQRGYEVVAVEPTDELRRRALLLHPSPSIEWVDDSLPKLDQVIDRAQEFNLVMPCWRHSWQTCAVRLAIGSGEWSVRFPGHVSEFKLYLP